ncbi:hypothetical protein AD998_06960 [bacterium 336/3]|nr:hypothetical protein AD998_06960 [bacterium 336/3]
MYSMLIYKYLYIILISLFLANCSEPSPPPPALNNDWQKMGLRGRVKYCFYENLEKNANMPKSFLYDRVYHFSQDGRLILSKETVHPIPDCGYNPYISASMILIKYKYYPNGAKAIFQYWENYTSSFAMIDSWLYDVEIHYPKDHAIKIHHVMEKKIETYDSLQKIRIKQSYSFRNNRMYLYEYHTEYDSSMHTSFFKEHSWSSDVNMNIRRNIIKLEKLLKKKTFPDSTYHITYAIFNRRDSSMDTTIIFVPNPSHTTDTYKYDKHGNWIEKTSRYGDHVKRKIEYW